MTLDNYVYRFERNPQASIGAGSTIKPDAEGARRYLRSIGKYNQKKGDRLLVYTGTGDFTLILRQQLNSTELLLTSQEMAQGEDRYYSGREQSK